MWILLTLTLLATETGNLGALAPASDAAPSAKPAQVVCSEFDPSKAYTPDQLENARLCREVSKLQEEVKSLRETNRTTASKLGFLIPWSGLIGGLFTALISGAVALTISIFGYNFRRSFDESQRQKLEQERKIQWEEHNIKLMAGLGSANRTRQLAAAAFIIQRIRDMDEDRDVSGSPEFKALSDVLVAVLRDPKLHESVAKYIAEEAVAKVEAKASKGAPPGQPKSLLKLSDYNLSGAKLKNVYWAKVSADNVDFFQADLSQASLRDASLRGARLYDTNLRKSVLVGADLSGANFERAQLHGARLTNAKIDGAINLDKAFWDETTVWPEGYQAPAASRADPAA